MAGNNETTSTSTGENVAKKPNAFLSRFRGHEVVDGISKPDLAVSAANVVYGGIGFGIMQLIKKVIAKDTKFGKFSIIKSLSKKEQASE